MKRLVIIGVVSLFCSLSVVSVTTRVESFSAENAAAAAASQDSAELRDRIAQLSSASALERAQAACALSEMGERAAAAIPQLIRLLSDETPVGRVECWRKGSRYSSTDDSTPGEQAAMALGRIGERAVEPLLSSIGSADIATRKNSAFALALIKDQRTVEPLIRAVSDAAWQVRERAAWGLGLKEDPRVPDALATAIRDGEWQVREQAAWALGLKGNRDSVALLTEALRDTSGRVRTQAAWALGLKGNESAVEPLMAALKDSEAKVREQAAWALGLKGDHRAVESLIAALKDEDGQTRAQAAWALGLKGDHRAVEALSDTMKDQEADVRRQATWALGMILMRDRRAADMNIKIDLNNLDVDPADPPAKRKRKAEGRQRDNSGDNGGR